MIVCRSETVITFQRTAVNEKIPKLMKTTIQLLVRPMISDVTIAGDERGVEGRAAPEGFRDTRREHAPEDAADGPGCSEDREDEGADAEHLLCEEDQRGEDDRTECVEDIRE